MKCGDDFGAPSHNPKNWMYHEFQGTINVDAAPSPVLTRCPHCLSEKKVQRLCPVNDVQHAHVHGGICTACQHSWHSEAVLTQPSAEQGESREEFERDRFGTAGPINDDAKELTKFRLMFYNAMNIAAMQGFPNADDCEVWLNNICDRANEAERPVLPVPPRWSSLNKIDGQEFVLRKEAEIYINEARASAPAFAPKCPNCESTDPGTPGILTCGHEFHAASPAVAAITHKMNLEIDCEDDGRWIAEWTNYPGCMAYGETRGEAVRKATDLLFEVAGKQFGAPQSPAVAGRTQGEEHMRWADFKEVLNIQDLLEEWQDKYVATHENGSWPENWERDWSGWIAGKIVETTLRESAREAPSGNNSQIKAVLRTCRELIKRGLSHTHTFVKGDNAICMCRMCMELMPEIEAALREAFPEAPAAPAQGESVKRIKILARKNLKMSPGKLAAQSVHAALMLNGADAAQSVVVLLVSDAKFGEAQIINDVRVVHDAGYTEVPSGTATCLAFFEDDPRYSGIFGVASPEPPDKESHGNKNEY